MLKRKIHFPKKALALAVSATIGVTLSRSRLWRSAYLIRCIPMIVLLLAVSGCAVMSPALQRGTERYGSLPYALDDTCITTAINAQPDVALLTHSEESKEHTTVSGKKFKVNYTTRLTAYRLNGDHFAKTFKVVVLDEGTTTIIHSMTAGAYQWQIDSVDNLLKQDYGPMMSVEEAVAKACRLPGGSAFLKEKYNTIRD